jgi:hypothetical protein
MRGRLVHPFAAELARIDYAGTAGDPDGTLPLASGYDPDFQETVLLATGPRGRTDARRELPPVRLPCQVEVGAFEVMQQLEGGDSPDSRILLVFHFRDLEQHGLVNPSTGAALLGVNDRLVAIYDLHGSLVQAIRTPPGLYATRVEPQSFGLGGARNLLIVTFEDREVSARSAS